MSEHEREDDATLPLVTGRPGATGGGGRRGHGQLLDPRAALPGAVKHVGGDKPTHVEHNADEQRARTRRRYYEFIHRLANPLDLAHQGNIPVALAHVYGISVEEAERRQIELHDELTTSVRSGGFSDALRVNNVGVEARVTLLARHAFSADPKVSLVGLRLLNDMDEGATAGANETIEDHIASMLDP